MKKIIIINLLLLCGICFCFGQNKKKYLVFSFCSKYEIEDYAHGTGDNLWVIPYDSCCSENLDKFRPLLIEEWAVDLATGPEAEFVRFGDFSTKFYDDYDYATKLLKNRREIQTRVTKYLYHKSKETFRIHLVPIIAELELHRFGINHMLVYTVKGDIEIWNDFWKIKDDRILQPILMIDFTKFDYRVGVLPTH